MSKERLTQIEEELKARRNDPVVKLVTEWASLRLEKHKEQLLDLEDPLVRGRGQEDRTLLKIFSVL